MKKLLTILAVFGLLAVSCGDTTGNEKQSKKITKPQADSGGSPGGSKPPPCTENCG